MQSTIPETNENLNIAYCCVVSPKSPSLSHTKIQHYTNVSRAFITLLLHCTHFLSNMHSWGISSIPTSSRSFRADIVLMSLARVAGWNPIFLIDLLSVSSIYWMVYTQLWKLRDKLGSIWYTRYTPKNVTCFPSWVCPMHAVKQRERGLNRNTTVSDTWKCGSLSSIFTHPPED